MAIGRLNLDISLPFLEGEAGHSCLHQTCLCFEGARLQPCHHSLSLTKTILQKICPKSRKAARFIERPFGRFYDYALTNCTTFHAARWIYNTYKRTWTYQSQPSQPNSSR